MTEVTDMRPEKLQEVLADPVAVELLDSEIPTRLAYIATDGTPRVVPIGFWWNGGEFIVCTAPLAPTVDSLRRNPHVALTIDTNDFPPHVLLVRGTASVEIVDGIPAEYFAASRKGGPVRQLMETQKN
jgi:hypothetical protein